MSLNIVLTFADNVIANRKDHLATSGHGEAFHAAGDPQPRRQQRRPGHHVFLTEQDEQRDHRHLHGTG